VEEGGVAGVGLVVHLAAGVEQLGLQAEQLLVEFVEGQGRDHGKVECRRTNVEGRAGRSAANLRPATRPSSSILPWSAASTSSPTSTSSSATATPRWPASPSPAGPTPSSSARRRGPCAT